jgi:hypothetical protein
MTAIVVCSDRPRVGRSLLTSIFAEALPTADVVAVTGSDALLRYADSGRVHSIPASDSVDQLQAEILTAVDAISKLFHYQILIDFPVPIGRSSDFFVDALHELGHEVRMAYIVSPDAISRQILLNSAFGKQADRLVAVINAYMPTAVKSWERSVEVQNWQGLTGIWSSPPSRVLPIINESHMSFSELWSASGGQHVINRQAIKWWYERTINNVCKSLL